MHDYLWFAMLNNAVMDLRKPGTTGARHIDDRSYNNALSQSDFHLDFHRYEGNEIFMRPCAPTAHCARAARTWVMT